MKHEAKFKLYQILPIYTMEGVEYITITKRECTYNLDADSFRIQYTYLNSKNKVESFNEELLYSFHELALKAIKLKEDDKL